MRSANRRHPRLHSHCGAAQPRSSRCTQSTRSTGSETHGGRPPSATSRSSRPGCPRNVALSVDERWYSRACRPRDTSFRDFLVTHGGNCQRSPASCLWGENYGWRASERDRTLRRTEVFSSATADPSRWALICPERVGSGGDRLPAFHHEGFATAGDLFAQKFTRAFE
jgi:hypothetical protein